MHEIDICVVMFDFRCSCLHTCSPPVLLDFVAIRTRRELEECIASNMRMRGLGEVVLQYAHKLRHCNDP